MNYYEHHLGDYAKDTGHLSMLEHGAYRILLDRYYGTESGIPEGQIYRLARAKTNEEREAVDAVLAEFFELIDGVWVNRRAEEEIIKANTRINAARANGSKGGRPKNQKETQKKPSGFSVGFENETQQKAHQAPSTTTHTPEENTTLLRAHAREEDCSDAGLSRKAGLAILLRQHGVDVNMSNPHLLAWVDAEVTDDEMLDAVTSARERKPAPARISAGYLNCIVGDIISDRAKKYPAGALTPPGLLSSTNPNRGNNHAKKSSVRSSVYDLASLAITRHDPGGANLYSDVDDVSPPMEQRHAL